MTVVPGAGEPFDFVVVEVNAMRKPRPFVQAAEILQIVERAAFVELLTKTVPILGFSKVRVRAHIQSFAKSAVERISEVVTEKGEQGASAICTIAPSPLW